jgi:hypothetical protein
MSKKRPQKGKTKAKRHVGPNIQLAVFRLLASSAAILPRSQTSLAENTCGINMHMDWFGNEHTLRLWFDMSCTLDAVHEILPEDFAQIKVTFRVSFNVLNPKFFPTTHASGNQIASSFVLEMVWPYWREYFQDTLVRMGYPPFVLPLFDNQPKLVMLPAGRKYEPPSVATPNPQPPTK